jgi:vacuolar-type H+-ATPase subunit I/STV1
MTTETTNNVTPEVQTQADIVGNFVKENDYATVVNRIIKLENDYKYANEALTQTRTELRNWKNSITEFLAEHIKDNAIDVDDLQELADELDIVLEQEIEVTFNVTVKFTGTVPLGFDTDRISDDMFDVRIDFSSRHDGVDLEEDYADIEDFEVEEKN